MLREEGFFTEWKQGNTPKEKPRDPAFGGVFFCLRIKKERFLTPLRFRVPCVSSLDCCDKDELTKEICLLRYIQRREIPAGRLNPHLLNVLNVLNVLGCSG